MGGATPFQTLSEKGPGGRLLVRQPLVTLMHVVVKDWIKKTLPDRAEKVLHQIEACHGGNLSDSRIGIRSRGEGQIAKQIHDMMRLAKKRYFKDRDYPKLNTNLNEPYKDGQMKMF